MIKNCLSRFLDKTFLRFIIVGIINTIFGTAVMFVAYNVFHCSYWLSSALNYILGSILSYFLNKYYTFKYKKKGWGSVIRFTINIAICYFIAYGAAKPLVAWLLSNQDTNIQENVAMGVGMCLFVILNYWGQRHFAFNTQK